MMRPAYVRGQLPVVTTGDWQPKKQTQPNPLRLNTLESATYAASEQGEPIEVKEPIFSGLARKKGVFSGNMNGAHPPLFPIGEEPKLETRKPRLEVRAFKTGNEAGMWFRMNTIHLTVTASIPDWQRTETGKWKIENGKTELGARSCGRGSRKNRTPNPGFRTPSPEHLIPV